MSANTKPIVGNWYQRLDKGQEFEVVAVDEDKGVVEIQHFDGDLEEIDVEAWYDLELEPIESPEDWTGPVDNIEMDDLGYDETDMEKDDWDEAYDEVRPSSSKFKRNVDEDWDDGLGDYRWDEDD